MAQANPPVQLRDDRKYNFKLRPCSKAELREAYGVTADVFRKYYLGDADTRAELNEIGYKPTSKYLSRKMVEIIVKYHEEP